MPSKYTYKINNSRYNRSKRIWEPFWYGFVLTLGIVTITTEIQLTNKESFHYG